ncbi:unnamed protein product [Adineta ricciae]|uniref:Uncharacterized protein n=1 Tax=Adineta ricciae TaxID=249248 RepID=A0A815KXX2_ADIRI|nr:unnamed protein product [Adineta ricciae]
MIFINLFIGLSVLDVAHRRFHRNFGKCDHLCESSLKQPDFRGRPAPGLVTNPYFLHSLPTRNFTAKQPSSRQQSEHYANISNNINRTYSFIY